jgi:phosphoglycolate phosphatase
MPYPPAVVFDLDGTLVDTAEDLHLVLHELMDEGGLPTPPLETMRGMIGDGARALVARAFAAEGVDPGPRRLEELYARFLDRYTAEPCRRSRLYPGVAAALDKLARAGCRFGVCTNKPQRPTVLLLEALGVADRFGAVIGGDVLPVRKPDPRHLGAVLERLDASPDTAVMVGDSRNDVLTAHAAGLPCVLYGHGYTTIPPRELGAEAVIDRWDELPTALAGLAGRALTPADALRTSR